MALPLFTTINKIIPQVGECIKNIKSNLADWKEYKETEEEKKLYEDKSSENSSSAGQIKQKWNLTLIFKIKSWINHCFMCPIFVIADYRLLFRQMDRSKSQMSVCSHHLRGSHYLRACHQRDHLACSRFRLEPIKYCCFPQQSWMDPPTTRQPVIVIHC